MKETIYTIPVNEAFETDCECPLCYLQEKLEQEAVDYALGAAMMEPDYRIESNEKGYCNRHFSMLFTNTNKLSLALVLDTHLEQIRMVLSEYEKKANSLTKGGLFKKSDVGRFGEKLSSAFNQKVHSCVVCDKVAHTMSRYIDVLLDMYESEPEFMNQFQNAKGFCMPHLIALTEAATKKYNSEKAVDFIVPLIKKQSEELLRLQEDIHKFTLKFDYRNADMDWGTAKDSPLRTIEKLSGNIIKNNN